MFELTQGMSDLLGCSLAMMGVQSVLGQNFRWRDLFKSVTPRGASEQPDDLADILYLLQEQAARICEAAKQHARRVEEINNQLLSHMADETEQSASAVLEAATQIIQSGRQMQDRCMPLLESLQQHRKRLGCRRNLTAITEGLAVRGFRNGGTFAAATTDAARAGLSLLGEPTEESLPSERIRYARESPSGSERDDTPLSESGFERRVAPRRPFDCTQQVAPFREGDKVETQEFDQVHCHNLSASGFAYWAADLPAQRYIVARFGAAPDVVHLVAEVMHATERDIDGQPMYLIGCRFLQRLTA